MAFRMAASEEKQFSSTEDWRHHFCKSCAEKLSLKKQLESLLILKKENKELAESLAKALNNLNAVAVLPLKINNTNAADTSVGFPFSRAYCDVTEINNEQYKFGTLFIKGIKIVKDYLKTPPVLPKEKVDIECLGKLLACLEEGKEIAKKLLPLKNSKETSLAVVLANHLFSKLGINPNFMIDKFYQVKPQLCPCGCKEDISHNYVDTSIGHEEVWHGRLDVILGGGVHLEVESVKSRSPGGKSFMEVKAGEESVDQVIAQTIVFSFLQQARHPEYNHFLIPGISACENELYFYFYDSVNDVLLTSTSINLMERYGVKFNDTAALTAWLVVNYKSLSTGLTGPLSSVPKSDFLRFVKPKLEIYRKNLRTGGVDFSLKRKLESHRLVIGLPETKYHKQLEEVLESESESESK